MARRKTELVVRKHNGDDMYSWAVFQPGNPKPLVSGCSRAEAQSHKRTLTKVLAERQNRHTL